MIAALLLLAPVAAGGGELFHRGLKALSVEPAGRHSLSSEDCARCHPAQARDWQGSRHRAAFTNPTFQASWQHWPNGWCLNCHLPLAEAQAEVTGTGAAAIAGVILPKPGTARSGGLSEEGVSCAVCHVRDGEILTPDPSWRARLFHPVREEPALRSAEFCGNCHEFPFQRHTPRFPFSYGEQLTQATLTEWRSSTAASEGETCQSCHMPGGAHSFPGAHDPALVRAAVQAEVLALDDQQVQVTITAESAAHAVPTGDPFRRLILDLCPSPDCEATVGQAVLRRSFELDAQSWTRSSDTTIPPATTGSRSARTLVVQTQAPAAYYKLWLYFGDARFHAALPEDEVRLLITEGAVQAPALP